MATGMIPPVASKPIRPARRASAASVLSLPCSPHLLRRRIDCCAIHQHCPHTHVQPRTVRQDHVYGAPPMIWGLPGYLARETLQRVLHSPWAGGDYPGCLQGLQVDRCCGLATSDERMTWRPASRRAASPPARAPGSHGRGAGLLVRRGGWLCGGSPSEGPTVAVTPGRLGTMPSSFCPVPGPFCPRWHRAPPRTRPCAAAPKVDLPPSTDAGMGIALC
jgi:hypothetical protein